MRRRRDALVLSGIWLEFRVSASQCWFVYPLRGLLSAAGRLIFRPGFVLSGTLVQISVSCITGVVTGRRVLFDLFLHFIVIMVC